MLGNDKANKTLQELAPDLLAGSGDDGVSVVTNPDPSGTTTTTAG
jgi:hypothetical protein